MSTDESGDPGLSPEAIHSRHFKDGYPLCWSYDQDGEFKGSYDDSEVTCPDCLHYMKA